MRYFFFFFGQAFFFFLPAGSCAWLWHFFGEIFYIQAQSCVSLAIWAPDMYLWVLLAQIQANQGNY